MMQFICLKQLRGVIIETPVVIAMVLYLCIQMIKGSYLSLVILVLPNKKVRNFLMKV